MREAGERERDPQVQAPPPGGFIHYSLDPFIKFPFTFLFKISCPLLHHHAETDGGPALDTHPLHVALWGRWARPPGGQQLGGASDGTSEPGLLENGKARCQASDVGLGSSGGTFLPRHSTHQFCVPGFISHPAVPLSWMPLGITF